TAGDGWHHTDGRLDTRAGRPSSQALPVSRQDRESPTLERRDGSKGTLVEGEQPARPESLSEHDQCGIREPDGQVAIAPDHRQGHAKFRPTEALHPKCSLGKVLDKRELDIDD